MGKAYGARQIRAIGAFPGLEKPVGRIQAGFVLRRDPVPPVAVQPAQDGVGQFGEPGKLRVLEQIDRGGDRRVGGRAEKQKLRRAQAEHLAYPRRRIAIKAAGQQIVHLA